MKKLRNLFCYALMIPLVFLSGCLFVNDGDTEYTDGEICEAKALYKAENYVLDSTISQYASFLIKELYANFGNVSSEAYQSLLADEYRPNREIASNYDKIRLQSQQTTINTSSPWIWTFSQSTQDAEVITSLEGAVEFYSTAAYQNAYYSAFVPVYSVAMEIVIYKIILNEDLPVFTISLDSQIGETAVWLDQYKTQKIEVLQNGDCQALSDAKQDFERKAAYVGLTAADVVQLKDYILENVIGSHLVGGVYDVIYLQSGTTNYSQLVDEILSIDPFNASEEEGVGYNSIFFPYPTSMLKDFSLESMYASAKSEDALSHIPAKEYQSILIRPSDSTKAITGLAFAIESELAMNFVVELYYFNAANSSHTKLDQYRVEHEGGLWKTENVYTLSGNGDHKVDKFSHDDLKAPQERNITNENGIAKYFSVIEEQGKISGVFNGSKIGQSYYEIVISLEKTAQQDYFPFKFGLVAIFDI